MQSTTHHTPVTSNLIRRSPGPGEGTAISRNSIFALGPGLSTQAQICCCVECVVIDIFSLIVIVLKGDSE